MPTARFTFLKIHQVSQDVGTEDEHMVSKVFFDFMIVDRSSNQSYFYDCLYCEVKQTVGSRLEDGLIEVNLPQGYDGPYDISAITDKARDYYIKSFGPKGRGIRFDRATCLNMRNNVFYEIEVTQFEVERRHREPGW